MKVLIAVLGFALLAQFASAYPGNQIDLPKTCTDVLSADACKKIEEFAVQLKLDAKEVLAIIQKVVNEGVTDGKELYAKVVAYIGELSCAKVLGADRCMKLADYVEKLKLNADELMVIIQKAAASGVTDAKELYAKIVKYISQFTCEKALGADTCKKIAEYAAKLKLSTEELMAVFKKAAESGITDAKELYTKIVKYISELTCAKVLGADRCARLQKLADLLSLNFEKVVLKLKEYYETGITSVTELYKKLVAYIKGSIFGDEAEIESLEKRGIVDGFYKMLKEKVNKFLDNLRNLPEITSEALNKIQAKFEWLIKSGKLLTIPQMISDLINKYFPKLQSDAEPMELDFASNDMPMEISLKDFKCSDALQKLLSVEFCKNIEDMAAKLQLTYDEVLEIIKNAKDVVTDVKKMYEQIVKFMNELSCAKILGADKCDRLEKLADLFSLNLNKLVLKLKEYYESGVTSIKALYKKVVDWITGIFGAQLEEQALVGFTDALKEKLMKKLNAAIEKLKNLPGITAELIKKIKEKIGELLKSKRFRDIANYLKDLYEKYSPKSDAVPMALEFKSNDMPMEISLKDFKCSDALQKLLSVEFCKNIEDMAAKLQLSYDEVLEIIKNAKDVVTDVKKMYGQIVKFMNELSCAKILGADKCKRIEMLADLFSINLNKVVLKLKEFFESGVTSVKDLYKKVAEWIAGIFGAELEDKFMEEHGLIGISDAWKEKLMEKLNAVIEKLKKLPDLTAEVIKKIQEKIEEFLKSQKFLAIAKYIKELFEKYFK